MSSDKKPVIPIVDVNDEDPIVIPVYGNRAEAIKDPTTNDDDDDMWQNNDAYENDDDENDDDDNDNDGDDNSNEEDNDEFIIDDIAEDPEEEISNIINERIKQLQMAENQVMDHDNTSDNDQHASPEQTAGRKKRGLPSKILANQQKYNEVLEKQQKMMSASKKKPPLDKKTNKNDTFVKKPDTPANTEGMRRVIVAGKVKYLPIINDSSSHKNPAPAQIQPAPTKQKSTDELDGNSILVHRKESNPTTKKQLPPSQQIQQQLQEQQPKPKPLRERITQEINKQQLADDSDTAPKRIPTAFAKKMEIHKAHVASQATTDKRNKSSSGKKIPSKYAKQIENDVKKQTVKNVKNFSDLRRIKALQEISTDGDIDANKASILELRKLKLEQRKKDQADQKKRAESNKKESAIQEILRNDKLTKFAKAVAIKNLSVASRNGTARQRQQQTTTLLH